MSTLNKDIAEIERMLKALIKSLEKKPCFACGYAGHALDSGKTFAGSAKEVGNHLMHLEKLDGKDYFDALIRIENISAIDTRFRDFKR